MVLADNFLDQLVLLARVNKNSAVFVLCLL